jgi:subtilisin family serine protease
MDGKEQQTGRTLFLLQKGATEEDFRVLATLLSAKTAFDGGGMHVWEGQGIGVLPIPYEQLASVVPPRVLWQHGIKSIEPELVFTTPSTPAVHEVPFDHLAALGVYKSTWHGNGIRVAFLDTGLDESHAGFAGRIIARGSMIGAITTADQHGHGTHCTALA